ncbi:baseplate J/gp47 family protein [Chryseobacterium vaccae]|uniref:baseplate J/gp47 family protein n=1 Tax=Chryseobacterium vaccae TaxID=2604424 RepID=UPI001296B2D3|nr:baseplate J/gp47 family protein [Chryseobacterium vaccae]
MENCSSKISIHQGMGTTQNARFLAALQPSYFLLDEREEIDYVVLAQKMSHYLSYFNESDSQNEQSDWSPFFAVESTAVLAQIFKWNIEDYEKKYENEKKSIALINDDKEQKKRILNIFEKIQDDFIRLTDKVNRIDDRISIKEFLVSSKINIEKQLNEILLRITEAGSILTLLQSYRLDKNIQQLFGLLLYWKNSTGEAFAQQLENYPSHTPHYALFLAFLKLLGIAKKHLNDFTKRHLDFYYKDILKLLPQKAQPDFVHLLIEPAADKEAFLLAKNTIFSAGKNSQGKNKFYASTSDQVINAVKIKYFLSHHLVQNTWKKADLLPLNAANIPFSAFPSSSEKTEIGLLLASPLFYMKGGTRTIILKFNPHSLDPNSFDFWITGEKKWIEITKENKELTEDEYIKLTIPASEKAIVPFNKEIHTGEAVATSHPVLKIIPINNTEKIDCKTLEIGISVSGLKNLIVATDTGVVDINKPFRPFGDFPKNGNGFIIGCNEFFMKKRAAARFSIESDALSSALSIGSVTYTLFNSSLLNTNLLNTNIQTFNKISAIQPFADTNMQASFNYSGIQAADFVNSMYISLIHHSKLLVMKNGQFVKSDQTNFNSIYTNNSPVSEYSEDTVPDKESISGYIRIQLDDTKYEGEKFMQDYIAAAKLPNPVLPAVPVIQSLNMDYSVTETYSFSPSDDHLNVLEYYHLLPFGYEKLNPKSSLSFIPDLPGQGEIYIGFENAQPGNGLSLLFQMAEGTANPRKEPAGISWAYLSENQWKSINSHDIGDETLGLLQSGIINLTIPEFDNTKTVVLPGHLFWLRISVSELDRICHFAGIHEQALKAVLFDFENNGSGFLEITPKETISKLYQPDSSVKKVKQPYPSFGGKRQEEDNQLYQRSSERLRHKQRSITSWDYERLILQEFPEVYRVKCLNHYRYDSKSVSNVSAGYVTLIPVAKSPGSSTVWEWKPLLSLSTLQRIKNRITEWCSPHVRLSVKPPILEKIQISCNVKYKDIPGADTRLYAKMLAETVNRYISPWAYSDLDIDFAKKIELSSLIQLIDKQSFVDYIIDFKVNQLILDDEENTVIKRLEEVKEIAPQTDYTLFIPNDSHEIKELQKNC